jgi:hypothetical protein
MIYRRHRKQKHVDDPSLLTPDSHIHTRYEVPWLKLPKGTPAFKNSYDSKKVWPKKSLERLRTALAG